MMDDEPIDLRVLRMSDDVIAARAHDAARTSSLGEEPRSVVATLASSWRSTAFALFAACVWLALAPPDVPARRPAHDTRVGLLVRVSDDAAAERARVGGVLGGAR